MRLQRSRSGARAGRSPAGPVFARSWDEPQPATGMLPLRRRAVRPGRAHIFTPLEVPEVLIPLLLRPAGDRVGTELHPSGLGRFSSRGRRTGLAGAR